ncbi:alpha/beta fold hydrolase [Streptosporangium canum]|uniref:alpha/beta fold hydrolase n=1 Tax=Streptosporangium canum TaxID=324952 RepID=UPI0037A502F2
MGATKADTLKVPGATLYYEIRGSGPLLLMIAGGPADASTFEGVAEALADRYTVLSFDNRGTSRSTLDGPPPETLPIEVQSDDAHHVLKAFATEPAYVLGCSGGALTALDLVARYPEQVRALVAHEPPAMTLLPDSERWQATFQDVYDTYVSEGLGPAGQKFMATLAVEGEDSPPPQMPDMSQMSPEMLEAMGRMQANTEFLFAHQLRTTINHVPDVAGLKAASTPVFVAVGEGSVGQMPHQAGLALVERLGTSPVYVPGDHQGFATHPGGFAEVVHKSFQES